MLDNHAYNLMMQMVQEHKSLWRIQNEYEKDARNCQECRAFWKKMEQAKTKHIKELEGLTRRHMK